MAHIVFCVVVALWAALVASGLVMYLSAGVLPGTVQRGNQQVVHGPFWWGMGEKLEIHSFSILEGKSSSESAYPLLTREPLPNGSNKVPALLCWQGLSLNLFCRPTPLQTDAEA